MDTARRRLPARAPWGLLLVVAAVAAGLLARTGAGQQALAALAPRLPWAARPAATLYYPDAAGRFLVPISVALAGDPADPGALVAALAAAPPAGLGLRPLIGDGGAAREVTLEGGAARLDVTAGGVGDAPLARLALAQTLAAWPGGAAAELMLEGAPAEAGRLLHYVAGELIVAVPTDAAGPRAALEAYLAGPADAGLTGLPAEVRLLGYALDGRNGLLRVELSYGPAVQALATERPETMRRALLGLIATLTAFPEVQAVMLDFEGHARLGVGQCADLLRTPQTRPEALNDARLLARER